MNTTYDSQIKKICHVTPRNLYSSVSLNYHQTCIPVASIVGVPVASIVGVHIASLVGVAQCGYSRMTAEVQLIPAGLATTMRSVKPKK